ncbi:MAG: lasso peptide biosynthesis B2 protein [Telmatospirillum sp.]|nr:lasso peptide biosynthesis B2 protein [Telmatospirillum sp.]
MVWVGLFQAAVLLLPARRLLPDLSGDDRIEAAAIAADGGNRTASARLVRDAVSGALRRLPWTPSCLVLALAARRMLSRRGIASRLHIGVDLISDDSGIGEARRLSAHAWLTCGRIGVTGLPGADGIREIAVFPPEPGGLDG